MGAGRTGAEEFPSEPVASDGPRPGPADGGGDGSGITNPVKLVVWDLDDTLWAGTLSEGPVTLDPARIDLVRALNRRGIVNSICSKNDAAGARLRLEQAGVWSEFVFPRIDWSPKGPRVARIIEDAQLRPDNVLFVDDLAINRAEVAHFVPGIQTAGPEVIGGLLDRPELAGKDDRDLTRLAQYRVLEQKLADRSAVAADNEEFLRLCDIRIGVFHDTGAQSERLFELVERTNQLNFTKRRPARDTFVAMLADPGFDTGYVRVRDRYGDYGICGFYAVSRDTGSVVDLLFSCRVLGMGVEQWVYDRLGRPPVTVVGEVASTLEGSAPWLTDESGSAWEPAATGPGRTGPSGAVADRTPRTRRILMVGGCDLTTTAEFLGGTITTEFSHVGPTGAFVHVGHTELLRQSALGLSPGQQALVDRIPFLDDRVFSSPAVVDPDYDVLVYSVLTDYTQGLYRHRSEGLLVPWHQYDRDVTDPGFRPLLASRFAREGMDAGFFDWFADEFEFVGGISPGRFADNLRWLAGMVPPDAEIVFLNGAEVVMDNPREPERHRRHRTMNEVVDRVVRDLPRASVCDVRTFVRYGDDVTDSIRHYRRQAYLTMAERIRSATESDLEVTPESASARVYRAVRGFVGRRRVQLRRLVRRMRGLPVSPRR